MFKSIRSAFGKGKVKARSDEVLYMLAGMASAVAATEEFRADSAFVRAYGVALGITVSEHVTTVAFPPKGVFPPYDTNFALDDAAFRDLASILAWRQCIAAFPDIDEVHESDDEREALRTALMQLCGAMYPPSERATTRINAYAKLLSDDDAVLAMREDYWIPDENPLFGIHVVIVNECLRGPDITIEGPTEPKFVFSLALHAMQTLNAASTYFRQRAAGIYKTHLSAEAP